MSVAKTDGAQPQKEAWLIVVLLFLFMLVNFADKAVIGIAAVPIIGNWVNAQTSPMTSNAQRVCTRLTIKPVTIADTANSR